MIVGRRHPRIRTSYCRGDLASPRTVSADALVLQAPDLLHEPAVLKAQLSRLAARARKFLGEDGHDHAQVPQAIEQLVGIDLSISSV